MEEAPVYSFASGQSALPADLLEMVQADVKGWRQSGSSVLALPFTCHDAREILHETETGIRQLLCVPDEYDVLFLQGGAYAQFGILALNFGNPNRLGAYVQTGHWSDRAANEAKPWMRVHCAAQGDGTRLPSPDEWDVPPRATYCHYTSNELAEGLQFKAVPRIAAVPLITDMTADFLTRPMPVRNLGLLYASSQKNLGIAGMTIVVAARAFLERCGDHVPAPFHYRRQAEQHSKVNTPPLFAISVAGNVCRWLIARGGLEAAGQRSAKKAALLYRLIEQHGFYSSPIDPEFRSNVSVRFHLPDPELEAMFRADARRNGLNHLEGHPSVGGLRASLYNLVTLEAVETLAEFMTEFERVRG